MTRSADGSFAQMWEDLQYKRRIGRAPPKIAPTWLLSRSIRTCPEVFQHRAPAEWASKAHVRELARGAKLGALDAVTIWWNGKHWICIDGHHRLLAYRTAGMMESAVPVQVFEGTPADAIAEAARRNTRDKLAMSRSEKTNAAWRLVIVGDLSKSKTVEASGASEGTVANMRRVRDALAAKRVAYGELRWEAARRLAAGEESEEFDSDEWTELEAQKMATAIAKAIGSRGSTQVDAFARALELYDARMPEMLQDCWGQHGEDE